MKQKELEFKRDEAIMKLGKLASVEGFNPSKEMEHRESELLSEIHRLDLEFQKIDNEKLRS